MVNVPKHLPKDRKDNNSMLIQDSHIFRFTTKFTQTRALREEIGKDVDPKSLTNYNTNFYDPQFEGVDLRAQMEKMENRTQGSLASKIATAKELNKMKDKTEDKGSYLQQFRFRNIDSSELAGLMRHEFLYDRTDKPDDEGDHRLDRLVSHAHLRENYKIDEQHEYGDLYTRKKTFLEKSESQGVKGYLNKNKNNSSQNNIKQGEHEHEKEMRKTKD